MLNALIHVILYQRYMRKKRDICITVQWGIRKKCSLSAKYPKANPKDSEKKLQYHDMPRITRARQRPSASRTSCAANWPLAG